MQHLVIQDVFQHEAGNASAVQSAADHDRPMDVVVMTKDAAGLP